MARWECAACGAMTDDLWGACAARRELRPAGGGWPAGKSQALLCPCDTQVDAAAQHRDGPDALPPAGFVPASTSWGEERPGAAAPFLAANLAEAIRVGILPVTYRRGPTG